MKYLFKSLYFPGIKQRERDIRDWLSTPKNPYAYDSVQTGSERKMSLEISMYFADVRQRHKFQKLGKS